MLILSSQWSIQKIHMQIKTTWFYLTTVSFVQIKSCKWVWPVFIPFDDALQFLYNKVEGKAVKLLGKEVFIIEPFKVRGFIVTQQQKHLKCKSIIFELLLLLFFFFLIKRKVRSVYISSCVVQLNIHSSVYRAWKLLCGAGSHCSPSAKWLGQRLPRKIWQCKQCKWTKYPERPKRAFADDAKGKANNQLE